MTVTVRDNTTIGLFVLAYRVTTLRTTVGLFVLTKYSIDIINNLVSDKIWL